MPESKKTTKKSTKKKEGTKAESSKGGKANSESSKTSARKVSSEILFVDLDGTLIKSDLFFEGFVRLLRNDPLKCLQIVILWLQSGRSVAKNELCKFIEPEFGEIPLNDVVVDYLKEQKKKRRRIVLATASDQTWAKKIYERFDFFTDLLASNREFNCKGEQKLEKMREYAKTHSKAETFEYLGNDYPDLDIWQYDDVTISVVSNDDLLLAAVHKIKEPKNVFHSEKQKSWESFLEACRPHQWVKNILLITPAVMAGHFFEWNVLFTLFFALICVSVLASGVYLLNDLLDIKDDRQHQTKHARPIARSAVQIKTALIASPVMMASALVLAALIGCDFFLTLLLYLIITTAYSFYLKKLAVVDILVLATLYSIRIFMGGAATDIYVSPWLIAFIMFFFCSLAGLKRYVEILNLKSIKKQIAGRGYVKEDLSILGIAGICSGFMSILVLALYITSAEVVKGYSAAQYLWLLCPVILFWLFRIWILANRKLVDQDPVLFAVKDQASYVILILSALIVFIAR